MKKVIVILFLMLIITACNPDRTNPLDVHNSASSKVVVQGIIRTERIPRVPIGGVKIYYDGGRVSTMSDSTGFYLIEFLSSVSSWLVFESDSYRKDSVFIDLKLEKIRNIDLYLNSNPVIESEMVSSIVENRYPNEKVFSLKIALKVNDIDNDIDSVVAKSPVNGSFLNLDYNPVSKLYENTFTLQQLGVVSLEGIVGKLFEFFVKDNEGFFIKTGEKGLLRIINEEPSFISPSDNELIDYPVNIKWLRFNAGYALTYKLQVFSNNEFPQLVIEVPNIQSNTTEIEIIQGLQQGAYYWVFWCVDEYGNSARSKPASFRIR